MNKLKITLTDLCMRYQTIGGVYISWILEQYCKFKHAESEKLASIVERLCNSRALTKNEV